MNGRPLPLTPDGEIKGDRDGAVTPLRYQNDSPFIARAATGTETLNDSKRSVKWDFFFRLIARQIFFISKCNIVPSDTIYNIKYYLENVDLSAESWELIIPSHISLIHFFHSGNLKVRSCQDGFSPLLLATSSLHLKITG